jgi:AcrR family transcriptional regulator
MKDKIIQATIELLKETQRADQVSLRQIARKADVAVSMINYHFQSKEHLIRLAVRSFIDSVIQAANQRPDQEPSGQADPIQGMRNYLKGAMAFVAKNPGISRVSILNDFIESSEEDNSSMVVESVYRHLKEIYGETKSRESLMLMAFSQVATAQVLFLRADRFKASTGIDFFDDKERNSLLDVLIDQTIMEGGTP